MFRRLTPTGPIEKGANEGQGQYCRDIFAALKAAVSARKPGAAVNGAVVKGKKKGKKGKSAQTSSPTSDHEHVVKPSVTSWGVFDPLQPVVGPVFDALKPLLTGNMVYGLLVGLLVATWFGFGTNRQATGVPDGRRDLLSHANDPQRLAAYEEMWLREESELWDWLEERVGLERLGRDGPPRQTRPKKGAVPAKERLVEDKLFAEKLDEREVMEAIRVTEERLRTLKSAVERRAEARGEAHTQSEGQAGGAHAMTQ